MRCSGCGSESDAGAAFCTYCGARLLYEASIPRLRIDAEKKALSEAMADRPRTDRRISPWIVLIPIIINLVAAAVVVAAVFQLMLEYDLSSGVIPTQEQLLSDLDWPLIVAVAASFMFYGIFATISYVLVNTSNKHLEREGRVREAVTAILRKVEGASPAHQRTATWDSHPVNIDDTGRGVKRMPLLWALVVLMPLLGALPQTYSLFTNDFHLYDRLTVVYYLILVVHVPLLFYMLHFMTDDVWRHDAAWTDFTVGARVALAQAGFTAGALEVGPPLQRRSTGLYILASVITLGLFLIYWWYAAINDRNTHFEKQARFEDQLMQLLSPDSRAPITRA